MARAGQKIGWVSYRAISESMLRPDDIRPLRRFARDRFHVSAVISRVTLFVRMRKATDAVVVAGQIAQAREVIAGSLRYPALRGYRDGAIKLLLAFARLAPVQCVTWGHPDTTGLLTVDYYISNDHAEPENGQDSYTEKLVRLEGVQSHYPRMAKPDVLPTRGSLGLSEEETFYLCPQNCIKIHPDMDAPLAEFYDVISTAISYCSRVLIRIGSNCCLTAGDRFSARRWIASRYCHIARWTRSLG